MCRLGFWTRSLFLWFGWFGALRFDRCFFWFEHFSLEVDDVVIAQEVIMRWFHTAYIWCQKGFWESVVLIEFHLWLENGNDIHEWSTSRHIGWIYWRPGFSLCYHILFNFMPFLDFLVVEFDIRQNSSASSRRHKHLFQCRIVQLVKFWSCFVAIVCEEECHRWKFKICQDLTYWSKYLETKAFRFWFGLFWISPTLCWDWPIPWFWKIVEKSAWIPSHKFTFHNFHLFISASWSWSPSAFADASWLLPSRNTRWSCPFLTCNNLYLPFRFWCLLCFGGLNVYDACFMTLRLLCRIIFMSGIVHN